MTKNQIIQQQDDNDFKKIFELVLRNYLFFIPILVVAMGLAFVYNKISVPVYEITASVLIKEDMSSGGGNRINNYLNSSLFGKNQNFQNEL